MKRRGVNEFAHAEVDAGFRTPCHQPLTWRGLPCNRSIEGYSRFRRAATGSTTFLLAHRVRYEAKRGPIPADLVPDHLCRNRWCCNPDHIELVTPTENLRRGRVAKLTPEQVRAIRERRAAGESCKHLAASFGVSVSAISCASRGQNWADGPCPAWQRVKDRRSTNATMTKE